MEKQIIIVKPKSLSPKDKEKLTKAGNIVIEHEDSTKIVFKPLAESQVLTFLNCAHCGERIYMNQERETVLRKNGVDFYCSQGHTNIFNRPKLTS